MAYVDEHQPRPEDEIENEDYQPTADEQAALKKGEKCFERAKKFKSNYDKDFNEYYNMFRGRQWNEQRPSYRHSEVVNLIWREIQASVPIQTDSRPKFEFQPMEPNDIELAEILNQVAEADWIKQNWSAQLTEMIYDSNIFGTGIGTMTFDAKANLGVGKIDLKSSDPFYIFPSPNAKDVNDSGEYFVEIEPMDICEIKEKWQKGKYVRPDMLDIKQMDLFDKEKVKLTSPTAGYIRANDNMQYDLKDDQQAIVITVYFDSKNEIEETKEDTPGEDGSIQTSYVKKKKYPNGRKLVFANKVVLEDGPNPYDDGLYPYFRVQNYVNQRQFWGISDIEALKSPQKVFNKIISFALDVMTLMGNPIWKVGTASGVDTENLFNQPGLIVEADDINQVQREEGVQLQPFVMQFIDRMKIWFDDISGSSDSSRGIRPEGVTAASAITALQEATQTRLRQKSRNLDSCLQNMGQMYLSRVFQFYTSPQVFRMTNLDGSMKFFKFHIDNIENGNGETTKVARYRPFNEGEDGKMFEGAETVKPISGMLDVKVSTGSALPFAKAEKESKLLNYFDRGIIDAEEVLKGSDYPNWESVLQRVSERQAQQAAAQAQAPQ